MSHRAQDIKTIIDGVHVIKRKLIACNLGKPCASKQGIALITPSQWAVLHVIMERDNPGVKEVADRLGITSSAATQLVEGLVEKGYVIRENDQMDRRAFVLRVSTTQKRKIELIKAETMKRFTQMFAALTDDEVALYAALNKKIVDGILPR